MSSELGRFLTTVHFGPNVCTVDHQPLLRYDQNSVRLVLYSGLLLSFARVQECVLYRVLLAAK